LDNRAGGRLARPAGSWAGLVHMTGQT
jgi:hypothetical protein